MIKTVKNQSWGMYNWYLGENQSRMEINLSNTFYWTNLLNLICHETYPGHHTEATVKDNNLNKRKGYFETTILLIYTPEIVIHEGIANLAERMLFKPLELAEIMLENLCPNPKLEDDFNLIVAQNALKRDISRIESNLAYNKHINHWSDQELIKYVKKFELFPEISIKQSLKFISDAIWAPYIFSYQGDSIITKKFGNPPSKISYRKILSEQTLASDLT